MSLANQVPLLDRLAMIAAEPGLTDNARARLPELVKAADGQNLSSTSWAKFRDEFLTKQAAIPVSLGLVFKSGTIATP